MELLRELHQTQRLAVALRMRHAEVAAQILFRITTTLMSDDHDRVAVESRPTADDRRVLTK